ncbi:MAG: L-histidine N(alpha)-methyltransferase, partial [Terriglobales bacterium]
MAAAPSALAAEVHLGLAGSGQKRLPCKYLYDEVGTLLFEAICALPEYGLTAADDRLLRAHAGGIAAAFPAGAMVAELGSG